MSDDHRRRMPDIADKQAGRGWMKLTLVSRVLASWRMMKLPEVMQEVSGAQNLYHVAYGVVFTRWHTFFNRVIWR